MEVKFISGDGTEGVEVEEEDADVGEEVVGEGEGVGVRESVWVGVHAEARPC